MAKDKGRSAKPTPVSKPPAKPATDKGPVLLLSQRFSDWLASVNACVALTTYQAGRLFFIGRKPDGGVRAHERIIEQCQGLWTDGQTLWTSGLFMLWRFENALRKGETTPLGADRKFVPREGRVTGRTDIHDIAIGEIDGARRPIFVNTLFGCLATVSETASFRPLWQPKFLTALVPEDRCHLNGLAMDGARPAYVSAVSRSDVSDGWRERRQDGGIVIDVASNEIVASGSVDAAFAAALRQEALAAQFRHRRVRHHRSGRRQIHAGLFLSGLCARACLHRPPCGDRAVAPAPQPDLRRARARRTACAKKTPPRAAAF